MFSFTSRYYNIALLEHETPDGNKIVYLRRRFVPPALFLVALAALCIGMARPQRTTLVAKDRATVILVVDVSRSMESKDVKPSRIGAATEAVRNRPRDKFTKIARRWQAAWRRDGQGTIGGSKLPCKSWSKLQHSKAFGIRFGAAA